MATGDDEEIRALHRKKTVKEAADKGKLNEFLAKSEAPKRTTEEERDYLARLERLKAALNRAKEKKQ